MKLNCLIVDDEYLARDLLEDYVSKVNHLELVGKCKSALEAVDILQEKKVDLLLLDIQMPDLTGLELLKTLSRQPAVIFTTAYSNYALEGFELNAVDYLLKPISFERFMKAVNKVTELAELKKEKSTTSSEKAETQRDHMFVKADGKLVKVRFKDILYIEGLREYVGIHTPDKRVVTLQAMKEMEKLLPTGQFMRIHKSYIVPLEKVDAVVGNCVEINKKLIPIGKTYRSEVLGHFSE